MRLSKSGTAVSLRSQNARLDCLVHMAERPGPELRQSRQVQAFVAVGLGKVGAEVTECKYEISASVPACFHQQSCHAVLGHCRCCH